MRSVGFRLLHVHLSGWWGLARFYSSQAPDPVRGHFISHDLPPAPRGLMLRGITGESMSDWNMDELLVREGREIFADKAEQTGVSLRVFGDQAPTVRKPSNVTLPRPSPESHQQMSGTGTHERRDAPSALE
jgi:hypothetical protein